MGSRSAVTALLFALILLAPGPRCAFAQAGAVVDMALIIGNNHHVEDSSWDLRFADDDALETAAHFRDMHPDGQVWLLVDPDEETRARRADLIAFPHRPPTYDNWRAAIAELHRAVWEARTAGASRVRLFVHFSGHGEKGGRLHLADTLLAPQGFREGLAEAGADEVFALMDGCHLAEVIRSGDRAETVAPAPIFAEQDLAVPARPSWLGFIGATTAVPEHDWLAGGLLTMVGVSGLLGPADLNGDDLITFFEWSRYIAGQIGGEGSLSAGLLMVPPNQDWQATVVDLKQSADRGVRLSPGFPDGLVRVIRLPGRELIAEFTWDGRQAVGLRLPPGAYEVVRIKERGGWDLGYFAADRIRITVSAGMVTLGERSELEAVALIPEQLRGGGDPPTTLTPVRISAREARSLARLPGGDAGAAPPIRPGLTLGLSLYSPSLGPALGVGGPPSPGGAVRVGWSAHPATRGRWIFSAGAVVQRGLWQVEGLPAGGALVDGRRHEWRLGPTLEQGWSWRKVSVSLQETAAWAPSFLTASGALLVDEGDPHGGWRYVLLRSGALEAALSVTTPVGDRWELGPVVRVEALRSQLSPRAVTAAEPVVSWDTLLSVGLELRQSPFRAGR